MPYYRCYITDRYGLPKVHSFEAEHDDHALAAVESVLASAGQEADRFELWSEQRLVHKREPALPRR